MRRASLRTKYKKTHRHDIFWKFFLNTRRITILVCRRITPLEINIDHPIGICEKIYTLEKNRNFRDYSCWVLTIKELIEKGEAMQ